jgi:citronellol/citronellal dehydrogenase
VTAVSHNSALREDALQGRVVLVTGGGTGIGRATALACAQAGAEVVICGRREGPLAEVAAQVESSGMAACTCLPVACDIREPDQVNRLVDTVLSSFGRVDVLVHCAGGQFLAPAEDISVNGWRAVHRLGVEAAWSVTREVAVRSMIPNRSGLIVFVAFSPQRGIAGMVHAAAARAAVANLAAGLALEWSRYGIRSVAVAAGTILTAGLREHYPPSVIDEWADGVPLGRLGRADEVGEVVAFLATSSAAYLTGTTIVVDGGADAWGAGRRAPHREDAAADRNPPSERPAMT